jgi:hypothetical protein
MTWEIPDQFFADQEPMGLGAREQPPTGAYEVSCIKSEFRAPRSNVNGEKAIYLDLRIENGTLKGMTFGGVRMSPPKADDAEKKRNVRDAEMKAAIICFNPGKAEAITKLRNVRNALKSDLFDGKRGHVWWEKGGKNTYPNYKFLTQKHYASITAGEFVPALKNKSDAGQSAGAVGGVATLGDPPDAPPVNGGGAPIAPMVPVAPDSGSDMGNLL